MPKNTVGKKSITSDCDRETDRPHQPQHLQDIVPDRDIRDIAKWADVVVEHEIPCSHDKRFHKCDHGSVPFTD